MLFGEPSNAVLACRLATIGAGSQYLTQSRATTCGADTAAARACSFAGSSTFNIRATPGNRAATPVALGASMATVVRGSGCRVRRSPSWQCWD